MTDRPPSPSQIPAVKATAIRMDAITDCMAMLMLTVGMLAGRLDSQLWFGAVCAIAGLMKLAAVRNKGGAVVALLGAASALVKVRLL